MVAEQQVVEKENAPPPAHHRLPPVVSRALSRIPLKPQWDDLDAEDAGDPLMVSEYVVEIFDYMLKLEVPQYTLCAHHLDPLSFVQLEANHAHSLLYR